MTRYAPLWQQAGSYAATLDRSLIGALWPGGGASGGAVTASATTMQVTAAPGVVAVPLQSGQGSALCRWDANEVPTLPAAPPSGQSRIDLVIVQVRDNALDAGANNDFIVTTVTGTAAASNPAVPATPTNAAALASVLVPGAVANLSTATLTDLRRPVLSQPRPGELIAYRHIPPPSTDWIVYQSTFAWVNSNAYVDFIVPATGSVLITLDARFVPASAGGNAYLSWFTSGTNGVGAVGDTVLTGPVESGAMRAYSFGVLSGLTPGAPQRLYLQGQWGAGSINMAFGGGSPIFIRVAAMPVST
jgi:hypothetical protein